MGIQDLQNVLESGAIEGGAVSVDLLRIARNIGPRQTQTPRNKNKFNNNKLKLVLDAECCLDRLYGGYFSDWACGGQWNRTVQFLSLLIHAIEMGNIELSVIFNGALEQQRMPEWVAEQNKIRQRINMVLKHINTKGTPPPKVWWCPPTCLRTVLRMALRHLNTTVLCSMDDHHQEVIAYCRENGLHGLVADDAEYAAFDPPRYFSSQNLKLTYKGSLETKEYMLPALVASLGLPPARLPLLAALLGNHLLPEHELTDIYRRAGITLAPTRPSADQLVRQLADFVGGLEGAGLDDVLGAVLARDDRRASLLRQSVQYYVNGTTEGFLKYRTATTRRPDLTPKPRARPAPVAATPPAHQATPAPHHAPASSSSSGGTTSRSDDNDLDTSGFASETTEREQKSLEDYKMATANAVLAPEIVIDQASTDGEGASLQSQNSTPRLENADDQQPTNGSVGTAGLLTSGSNSSSGASSMSTSPRHATATDKFRVPVEVMRTATERHQKGLMSPLIYHTLVSNEVRLPCVMEDDQHREFPPAHFIFRPVRQKVYAILFNLHHLQYLANKSRKTDENSVGVNTNCVNTNSVNTNGVNPAPIDATNAAASISGVNTFLNTIPLNTNSGTDAASATGQKPAGGAAPPAHFKPVNTAKSGAPVPEMLVREWTWSKGNQYQRADVVRAVPLGWAVPTIQRLWFGATVDDKRRRLRAFLTCLSSDAALMLNPSYVPQHMLMLACVLRYVMSCGAEKCVLRKQELDAFIAQAFAPELMNSQYLQELTLPLVTSRGAQLAALFMHGVETALLANDACGAPIPWLMSCPWLYFDGKLFHHALARAAIVKNLLELCENHIERVVKVERMRKAILEGLDVQFAKPPLPPLSGLIRSGLPPPNCLPPVSLPSTRGPAGLARRMPAPARGGQLQVAGVVVGQWGANYGFSQQQQQQQQQHGGRTPAQLAAAATYGALGRGRGLPPNAYAGAGRGGYAPPHGKGSNRAPAWGTNKKMMNNNKKKAAPKRGKARGITVQLQSGETVLAAEVVKKDTVSGAVSAATGAAPEHQGQGDGPVVR